MENFPKMIPKDVDVLLESEQHMITLENDALKLEKEQLTSQLNEQTKLFETKEQEVQQLRHELQAYESEKVHAKRRGGVQCIDRLAASPTVINEEECYYQH